MSANPSADREDPRRYEHLTTLRLEDPSAVARAATTRIRHEGARAGKQNFIIAADHPHAARYRLAIAPWSWQIAANCWTDSRLPCKTPPLTASWPALTSLMTCCCSAHSSTNWSLVQ